VHLRDVQESEVRLGASGLSVGGLEPLLATLAEKVIAPAEGKTKALQERPRKFEAEQLTKPQ